VKIHYILTITLSSVIFSTYLYSKQPSFDCSKVEKQSCEAIICSSDILIDLDNKLSDVYKQALSKAPKEDMLKAYQRGWIKGRNECWKVKDAEAYMVDLYRQRINELKEKYQLNDGNQEVNGDTGKFDKTLSLHGITFHVTATNEGSINHLTIKPSGLKIDNSVIEQEIEGTVSGVEIADINVDGSPEIYIYVNSAGSGSYGSVVAYSANHNKSLSPIYLEPLDNDQKNSAGYMGHDEFTIIENTFARRFPLYNEGDPNCCPKGGTRQLQYKLIMGEASWQLKLDKSITY